MRGSSSTAVNQANPSDFKHEAARIQQKDILVRREPRKYTRY